MKRSTIVIGALIIIVIVEGFFLVNSLNKQNINPIDRYSEHANGQDGSKDEEIIPSITPVETAGDADEKVDITPTPVVKQSLSRPASHLIKDGVATFLNPSERGVVDDIRYTIDSYFIIDGKDIQSYENYGLVKEGFCTFDIENMPFTHRSRVIDEEGLKSDEEYQKQMAIDIEMHQNDKMYIDKEIVAQDELVSSIVERYTTYYDYEITYVFFNGNVENLGEENQDVYLNICSLFLTDETYEKFESGFMGVYYDSLFHGLDNPEEGHDSAKMLLNPGEKRKYTMGYMLYRNDERETSPVDLNYVFFGLYDSDIAQKWENGESKYSPIYGKNVFAVVDLPQRNE